MPREIKFSWTRREWLDEEEVETACTVTATISGRHVAATRLDPQEWPEVDIVAVIQDDTGADVTEDLTSEEQADLQAMAEEEAEQEAIGAQADEDDRRHDAARDDRMEG
jgi:Holliday junction resolvase